MEMLQHYVLVAMHLKRLQIVIETCDVYVTMVMAFLMNRIWNWLNNMYILLACRLQGLYVNQYSHLLECMISILHGADGVCSKVLIVAADADPQRIKYLFLNQSLPLAYKNVGRVGCSQFMLHAEKLHADSFRHESNLALFVWHHTGDNKFPL